MKKLVSMVLLCALLLTACGKDEDIPMESSTLCFVDFVLQSGEEMAVVRYVENINGEYTDTQREEKLSFAKDVLIRSFDLRMDPVPAESSVTEMTLAQFKEAALLSKDGALPVYRVELADGKIYSVNPTLSFFGTAEQNEFVCALCGEAFAAETELDSHDCPEKPEPTPTPEPTATPGPEPVPAGSPGSRQCPLCADWYAEGDDYLDHDCIDGDVACPLCGQWYEAGRAFLSHPCALLAETFRDASASSGPAPTAKPAATAAPKKLQCPLCSGWYAEGEEYLGHTCLGYSVACPLCGQWYEAGRAFLTHPCADAAPAPAPTSAPAATPAPGGSGSGGRIQCQRCLEWYDPGDGSYIHYCAVATPGPGDSVVMCQVCQLLFQDQSQYERHHCQGRPGQTCTGCNQYFFTTYEYDTHSCPGRVNQSRCSHCGQWMNSSELDAHVSLKHPDKLSVQCPQCGVNVHQNAYNAHLQSCQGSATPSACFYCGVTFVDLRELEAHIHTCTANPNNQP